MAIYQIDMKRQIGFTLIELMTGLAVAGVLLSLAVPSFNNLIMDNRRSARLNDLVAHLNIARSEAIRRSKPVMLCTSSFAANPPQCDGGANWENGFMSWVDLDRSGAANPSNLNEILRTYQDAPVPNFSIRSANIANQIVFDTRARPDDPGSFTVCDQRGAGYARAVLLRPTGRAGSSQWDAGGNALALACPP